jgi:ParB family chromosome partitioning protein
MKKKALGRGLGALIPKIDDLATSPNEIDIDLIKPNPKQPRFKMDETSLEELAASIRDHGVLQPVLVRPLEVGYELIAGERRLLAAQRAGLLKVPAIVRDVPDEQMLQLALIENIQREQLNPIEEAQAYQELLESLETTQEKLSAYLGKERSTIANALRLLKLPRTVRELVADGRLSAGHARALLASSIPSQDMGRAAAAMVKESWSVREAERWAKKRTLGSKPAAEPEDPDVAAATDRLRIKLGTKVEIKSNRKGSGQIRIAFYDQDDLARIYGILTEESQ